MEEKVDSAVLSKDILREKKPVTLRLTRELHTALRVWTFQRGVTIQEVVEEFVRRLVEGDKRANGIVDSYILQSLRLHKPAPRVKSDRIVELSDEDKGSLYDLINNDESPDDNA